MKGAAGGFALFGFLPAALEESRPFKKIIQYKKRRNAFDGFSNSSSLSL